MISSDQFEVHVCTHCGLMGYYDARQVRGKAGMWGKGRGEFEGCLEWERWPGVPSLQILFL